MQGFPIHFQMTWANWYWELCPWRWLVVIIVAHNLNKEIQNIGTYILFDENDNK